MHNHHVMINRQARDPAKFDVLDLFAAIGRDKKYILGDEEDEAAFVDIISNALSANKTPTMIYGRRVEVMFAYMVASLGKCALAKKEDCGDVFVGDGSIEIPDYSIVLNSISSEYMLIEVKNYHQKNAFNEYTMNFDYLVGLSRYADLVKTVLRIAIHWSKWCIWTLVSPADFERNGTKAIISLSTAMMRNHMSVLGDVMIGTTPPLAMRLDKQHTNSIIENNTAVITISKVEILCKSTPITLEREQRIAFALMLFGKREENNFAVTSPHSENEIEYIEFSYCIRSMTMSRVFALLAPLVPSFRGSMDSSLRQTVKCSACLWTFRPECLVL